MKGDTDMSAVARAMERRDARHAKMRAEADRLWSIIDATEVSVQAKNEAKAELDALRERDGQRREQADEVRQAYEVISRALNSGRKDDVLLALAGEHSTLLGQLWNAVTDVAEARSSDGRVEAISKIVQGKRNPFI
jgi:hypothetical protein